VGRSTGILLSIAIGATLGAGCERTEPPPKPISMAATHADTVPADTPAPGAQSARDPSLPDAEVALKAQSEEKNESDLSQNEVRKDMPHPGQANDHSTDAFAKRNETSSGTPPKNATPGDSETPSDAAPDAPSSKDTNDAAAKKDVNDDTAKGGATIEKGRPPT
jgi:hypothetical protein